jgi:hypothetical protein
MKAMQHCSAEMKPDPIIQNPNVFYKVMVQSALQQERFHSDANDVAKISRCGGNLSVRRIEKCSKITDAKLNYT